MVQVRVVMKPRMRLIERRMGGVMRQIRISVKEDMLRLLPRQQRGERICLIGVQRIVRGIGVGVKDVMFAALPSGERG